MLLNDFKKAVDSCKADITDNDLQNACTKLEIDTSYSYSMSMVSDKLGELIKTSLSFDYKIAESKISRHKLLKLQSDLVYRYILNGEDPVEYLSVLNVLNQTCRGETNTPYFPAFSETEKWNTAIINCKNFNFLFPDIYVRHLSTIRSDFPEEYDRAISVKMLVGMGCTYEIQDSNIIIEESGLEEVMRNLNEKVKTFGGINLASRIFHFLVNNNSYSTRFERYYLIRQMTGLGFDVKPQVPFGMLLNLSLKHPQQNPLPYNENLFREIISISSIVANGVYGVQSYDYWGHHYHTGETIIGFCQQMVLWDSLFSLSQYRPSTALEIIGNLFTIIDNDEFERLLGFTLYELLVVAEKVNISVADIHLPEFIDHSEVMKGLNVQSEKVKAILDFLSHDKPVNADYVIPQDYIHINFFEKPFIKTGDTKYLYMNKSWSAPNYFEVLATFFRNEFKNQGKDFDHILGNQLELFIQKKLIDKNIAFSTGKYKDGRLYGECDLLIESDDMILLIEVKKKSLTRKAKSGGDIEIFLDLCETVLFGHHQTGRTELFLLEKGQLTLDDNGTKKTISLNGRKIERIVMAQQEFGGFQDKTFIEQFLTSLLTHSFHTDSEVKNIQDRFTKLGKKQAEFVDQYKKHVELDKGYHMRPFFNCEFISLPQLIEVIHTANDNNSFADSMVKTKFITFQTYDWYKEFETVEQMKLK